ncbi:MAG: ABC transporter ATP-binding protein [Lachnospiraceae bacterium]|nr:ABC transporter ATP-binding protein [Lachnospiraceae bacterium]
MGKLLVYLKSYWKESILAPLFKMLEASFELFIPLVVAAIIDKGIGGGNETYIFKMGGVMILLGVIGLACSVTAQYFSAKAAVGFAAKVKSALFHHIQELSYMEIDTLGTYAMITRMTSDMNQVQSGVNLTLRLLLRSPFVVFGAMIMAFTVNGPAALIFVVIIPLLCIVVFGIMLFNIPMYRKVQNSLDRVLGSTRENLTGARVIRAFNKQESEIKGYKEKTAQLNKLQLFAGKISGLMNPVTYVIINGGIIALLWSGAIQADRGAITQGELTALVNYMSQILVELVKMANLIISITKAVACGNRIQAVFEIRPGMKYGSRPAKARGGQEEAKNSEHEPSAKEAGASARQEEILRFDHVSLKYQNAGEESLTDLNLQVKSGDTVGIIGGTGSGKTALVNLIARFYDATEGRIFLHGADIREYSESALRDMIGIVPQKSVLFQGTIEENLKWGKRDASLQEMNRALEIAQAAEFVKERPEGLLTPIEQGGKNLSGGQRQRLTIARAMVKEPEILILDDSASALDFATDAKLRRAIRDMEPMPTVFIVSQRASSIQYADQIIVLEDGRIAGTGTHEELLASCEVYQEIYYSQFPKEGAVNA